MESRSLLRLVRYHWAVILVCAVVGVLLGQAVAVLTPREYTSSADVFVTVTGGTSTGEVAQSGNFSQQQARNFSAIATREVVLAPVIEALDLDMTINQLRGQVSTSVPLNTSVITISATDESPERAAAIANSVATYLAEVVPSLTPRVDGETPVRLQVIETATPPSRPSSPNVPMMLLFGLLGGLVVAAAVVVFRGVVDARVRSKEEAASITGVAVLGAISLDRRFARKPMALATDTRSLRSEEYRQLRANLRFLQTGQTQRIFVFTSSIPGEGKSSTAANTAAALAASGLAVCLVEADLRRPALAGVLDLPAGVGLTSVIMGDVSLEDALLEWGPDKMKVLLSGPIPPNPSELLEAPATFALLQSIKQQFDVTIIDCPPLNPVSDAAVIARSIGGVILVVGAGRVRVRELRRAVDRLAAVGAHIDGTVLNLARTSDTRRYRYSSYSSDRIGHTAEPTAVVTVDETVLDVEAPDELRADDLDEAAVASLAATREDDVERGEHDPDDARSETDDAALDREDVEVGDLDETTAPVPTTPPETPKRRPFPFAPVRTSQVIDTEADPLNGHKS